MRLFFLFAIFVSVNAGLFSFFGKKETVTKPDTQVQEVPSDSHQGSIVEIPKNSIPSSNIGAEVHIPKNEEPSTKPSIKRITTTTIRPMIATTRSSQVSSISTSCPRTLKAMSTAPAFVSLLFDEKDVYVLSSDRVQSKHSITEVFPDGPRSINAAVYDSEKQLMVLFEGRKVYGYKRESTTRYKLHSDYPKDLPANVAFTPSAAAVWADGHLILLSNTGAFALYDEYWNKSLKTGKTQDYFKGVPDETVGISSWSAGKASIFGINTVYKYDLNTEKAVGTELSSFLKC